MRAKKQIKFSNNMLEKTEALKTKLDRPVHFIRDAPFPMKQFHHMKSREVFTKLQKVEWEIIQKLQKLKMECFGNDRTKAKTKTVFCNSIYEHTKPLRMYYLEIEETNIQFKIPEIPEEFRKLWQKELDIIEKLHKLKLNQVRLDQKRKCFSRSGMSGTRQKIECKLQEIERLKESLHELYVYRKPLQRKDRDDICPLHDRIVKLHNGRHGSENVVKERQLIKKINQARVEVEKIRASSPSAPVTRIYTRRGDILDTKEALVDYIKVTSREVEELRMKQMRYMAYDGRAKLEKAATEKEIKILERKLDTINQKKTKLASKPQFTAQI